MHVIVAVYVFFSSSVICTPNNRVIFVDMTLIGDKTYTKENTLQPFLRILWRIEQRFDMRGLRIRTM